MGGKMSAEAVHEHDGSGMRLYLWVWIWLLALTALEIVLALVQILPTRGMLVLLMVLSFVKAGLIVAYFMHLRFEQRTLVLSLIPSVLAVIALLFVFFPDGFRLLELRVP
jgi:cytochrome c oxidase subunit 4